MAKVKCVFVHGWAMNSAIWEPFIHRLPDNIEPYCIDLPGHGQFKDQAFESLDDLTVHLDQQSAELDESAIWVGWSLGVLPVLQLAAKRPDKVAKVFALASNPCFVVAENWSSGVDVSVFDQFADNLRDNIEKTLQRFLSLQVQGAGDMRNVLRHLRQTIASRGLPATTALNAGLEVLKQSDCRSLLNQIKQPQAWVLGERDTLIPSQLEDYLSGQLGLESHIISGAAHLPFLSHADEVQQLLTKFIDA